MRVVAIMVIVLLSLISVLYIFVPHQPSNPSNMGRAFFEGSSREGKYLYLLTEDTSFGAAVWSSRDLVRFEGTAAGVIRDKKFYLFGTEQIGQFVGDSVEITIAKHTFMVGRKPTNGTLF